MNSTTKGDAFEAKVLDLLSEEIAADRFFLPKTCCQVFAKKGYYSKDREKKIVFDIAIETYLPGQNTYSLLTLVECKDYGSAVPVNDIEEFFCKMQQVGGTNIKGIVASTNSFQEGAIRFSKSKGIGLLRIFDRAKLNWVLTRSPSSLVSLNVAAEHWLSAMRGIKEESFRSDYLDCYCCVDDQYTNSLNQFFFRLIKSDLTDNLKAWVESIGDRADFDPTIVAYKEDSVIEGICDSLLAQVNYDSGRVPLHLICNQISEEFGLRVIFTNYASSYSGERDILGKITFDPLEITIFTDGEGHKPRQIFTLAHELGHFFLDHSKYMSGENCKERDVDLDNPERIGVKDITRMEWQANYFASCLLLPRHSFLTDFADIIAGLELKNRGFGVLYVDNQKCNLDNFYSVSNFLKNKYAVSRSVVKHRLKKLGLLIES